MKDPDAWATGVQVEDLDDGGMGSLALDTPTRIGPRRVVVCRAAVQFTDVDGVEVVASLYVDEQGAPFELDIWKTDFSPLVHIPDQLRRVEE
jgi:hypothetical protein